MGFFCIKWLPDGSVDKYKYGFLMNLYHSLISHFLICLGLGEKSCVDSRRDQDRA